jgi:hypothetical protein
LILEAGIELKAYVAFLVYHVDLVWLFNLNILNKIVASASGRVNNLNSIIESNYTVEFSTPIFSRCAYNE